MKIKIVSGVSGHNAGETLDRVPTHRKAQSHTHNHALQTIQNQSTMHDLGL